MLEQQWNDNIYTVEGAIQHDRVHDDRREMRRDIIRLTSVPVISTKLRLSGKSDCVELIGDDSGICIPGFSGKWCVVPVEYKHGVRRDELEYEAQVCAQAICLEEMWGCTIQEAFIFYAAERRRKTVELTVDLRYKTQDAARKLQDMLRSGTTPAPVKTRRCKGCSMRDQCIPELNRKTSVYIQNLVKAATGDDDL